MNEVVEGGSIEGVGLQIFSGIPSVKIYNI